MSNKLTNTNKLPAINFKELMSTEFEPLSDYEKESIVEFKEMYQGNSTAEEKKNYSEALKAISKLTNPQSLLLSKQILEKHLVSLIGMLPVHTNQLIEALERINNVYRWLHSKEGTPSEESKDMEYMKFMIEYPKSSPLASEELKRKLREVVLFSTNVELKRKEMFIENIKKEDKIND